MEGAAQIKLRKYIRKVILVETVVIGAGDVITRLFPAAAGVT